MITGQPSISAIIPVFNGERYLGEAIESALAQSLPPAEIIVMDDGSTDGTAEVARQFGSRVNYRWQPHAGVAAARNSGLAAARCDWIAFLDADDIWLPHKLRLQANCLLAEPQLQYVTAYAELFLEAGCPWPLNYKPEWRDNKQFGLLGPLLARKTAFEIVGGFDPQLRCAEDMDWFARAKDLRVPCAALEETLLRKRVHSSNITVTLDAQVTETALLQVMRNTVNRQRGRVQPPG